MARTLTRYLALQTLVQTTRRAYSRPRPPAWTIVVELDSLVSKFGSVPAFPHTSYELVSVSLGNYGGDTMLKAIAVERHAIFERFERDKSLRQLTNETGCAPFETAWKELRVDYPNLMTYAAGHATVLPSTRTVKGDISILKHIKSVTRRSLSNYALSSMPAVSVKTRQ
ncbi:hypothetical protein ACHHYP_09392 [Achlya hypogyna]|uniref:Uncharacterized protein n=1 Tax=Achlya hypogyna TaxID=1202772 RepID=A0A1V9YN77_ACHHY|nr:hypothetical protein ACHHYP_09392 [Achlya hypogyna]